MTPCHGMPNFDDVINDVIKIAKNPKWRTKLR